MSGLVSGPTSSQAKIKRNVKGIHDDAVTEAEMRDQRVGHGRATSLWPGGGDRDATWHRRVSSGFNKINTNIVH